MPPPNIKLGPTSGEHGSYSFYRSFKYLSKGKWRHIQLGRFFFIRVSKDSPVCIGELQLVWTGKNSHHPLTSIRLYYLPEQTPEGRLSHHGQDELIATEKIVLHAKDLIKWISYEGVDWNLGLPFFQEKNKSCQCRRIDGLSCNVQILNFSNYCRVKTVMKRIEGSNTTLEDAISNNDLSCVYGLKLLVPNSYVMFSREIFENPELERHEYRCDHLAPNLKGRPRKKSKGRQAHQDVKTEPSSQAHCSKEPESKIKPSTPEERFKQLLSSREKFTKMLHQFMKDEGTPITKIPSLGFKKVDLFSFFCHAHSLGGYQQICQKRLWKHLYDLMGGNPRNTSAANCTKRQYERLLLRYERHVVKKYGGSVVFKTDSKKTSSSSKTKSVKKEAKDTDDIVSSLKEEDTSPSENLLTSVGLVSTLDHNKTSQQKGQLMVKLEKTQSMEIEKVCKQDIDIKPQKDEGASSHPSNRPSSGTSVVSTSATWKVPVSSCSSTSSSSAKQDSIKPKTVESKIAKSNDGSRKITLDVDSKSSSQESTGEKCIPAHCVQKAPMPLHVLGPCHPSKLAHAQRSPWRVRLTTSYHNPEVIHCPAGPTQKISELKRSGGEEAIDLSYKRCKLDIPKVSPPPTMADGVMDLSIKKKSSAVIEDTSARLVQPPLQKATAEPLNFVKKKLPSTSAFHSPPSLLMKTEIKREMSAPYLSSHQRPSTSYSPTLTKTSNLMTPSYKTGSRPVIVPATTVTQPYASTANIDYGVRVSQSINNPRKQNTPTLGYAEANSLQLLKPAIPTMPTLQPQILPAQRDLLYPPSSMPQYAVLSNSLTTKKPPTHADSLQVHTSKEFLPKSTSSPSKLLIPPPAHSNLAQSHSQLQRVPQVPSLSSSKFSTPVGQPIKDDPTNSPQTKSSMDVKYHVDTKPPPAHGGSHNSSKSNYQQSLSAENLHSPQTTISLIPSYGSSARPLSSPDRRTMVDHRHQQEITSIKQRHSRDFGSHTLRNPIISVPAARFEQPIQIPQTISSASTLENHSAAFFGKPDLHNMQAKSPNSGPLQTRSLLSTGNIPSMPHMQMQQVLRGRPGLQPQTSLPPMLPAPPRLQPIPSRHLSQYPSQKQ